MKYLFFTFLYLSKLCFVFGQENPEEPQKTRKNLFVGVNVMRPIIISLREGISLDLTTKYRYKNLAFEADFGYTSYARKDLTFNFENYTNIGTYQKILCNYIFNDKRSDIASYKVGAGFIRSKNKETGNIKFQGNYFADANTPYTRDMELWAFCIQHGVYLKVYKNFFVDLSMNYNFSLQHKETNTTPTQSLPYQYFAGMGTHFGGNSEKPFYLTLNFQAQILYMFF